RGDPDTARGKRFSGSAGERIGEAGVADVQIALLLAVDAQRLLVILRREPVVEDSAAAANRRVSLLERRPCEPGARHEVVPVVKIALQFVTRAETEREAFENSPVILRVPPELDLIEVNAARAGSPPEARWPPRAKGLDTGEDERAVLVAKI